VDDQTARILGALDPVGVELLLMLLAEPMTEASLVEAMVDVKQPTVHRRLARLADAGLIVHEVGPPHTPGLLWSVRHSQEIDAVLQRLLDLSDAVAEAGRAQRTEARRRLRLARADRRGFRDVGSIHPE
jgi:predicted transcriptional regulator